MHKFTDSDWARRLAKCGKPTHVIARILSVPEATVKQWVGAIREPRKAAAWEDDYEPRDCSEPTNAPVGSWERIKAMRKRWESGEDLYHALDSKQQSEPCQQGGKYSGPGGIRVCAVKVERKRVGDT